MLPDDLLTEAVQGHCFRIAFGICVRASATVNKIKSRREMIQIGVK